LSSLTLQRLGVADFSAIYAIETVSHAIPWTKNVLRDTLAGKAAVWGLCVADVLKGFVVVSSVLDEAEIHNICVHPDFQGQGLGKAMLQALIRKLAVQKVQVIYLEARASNDKALGLYHSVGFNVIDQRKAYYPCQNGDKEDAIVLRYRQDDSW